MHPGKCEDAPDNTDARRECGLCSACFQRTCAPAQPGTDPNARCPSGQLCGASQSCGLPGGAACTADLDCALGQCIAGACEQVTVERIQVDPMAQNPTGRSVRGLALSPSGGLGVLFGEYSETGAHSVQAESDLFLAQRSPQGVITATSLFTDRDVTRGRLIAAVTYLGPTALVVASSREAENTGCAAAGEPPCGVFAMLVSPAGQAGRPEVVDGAIRVADQVVLRQDESGAVFAFYDGEAPGDTGQKIRVRRRDVTPTGVVWTALGVIDPGLPDWGYVSWDAEVLDGKPVVLVADSSNANTLKLWQPGVAADVAPLPSPGGECDPFSVRAIRAGAPGHERLLVSFGCYRTFEFATWDPVARWSIAEYGAVLLLQPLGAPGGAAASVAELDSPDSTPIAELHLGLQQGGTWSDRLLFRPRGAEDVDTFAAAAGPGGLPQVAVATGLVASDPSGGSPFIRGLNLFLIRVHP